MKPNPRWTIARHVLLPLLGFWICAVAVVLAAKRYPHYAGIAAGVVALAAFLNAWRVKKKDLARGWRCRRHGRDEFYYEEFIDGKWLRIAIDGEMLVGKPKHVFYLPTEDDWRLLPEWARHRRTEILARMKSDYPETDYAYENG